MTQKLTEIMSTHELREIQGETIKIEKGVWIEISDFDADTEQVFIKKRYEVIDIEKTETEDKDYYDIICRKMNFEEDEQRKKLLAEKIIEKHHDMIKSSFVKCLIDGIGDKSVKQLKSILYKLRGDIKDDELQ
jgi:fructose-bisphosphate aldolase class 1